MCLSLGFITKLTNDNIIYVKKAAVRSCDIVAVQDSFGPGSMLGVFAHLLRSGLHAFICDYAHYIIMLYPYSDLNKKKKILGLGGITF